MVVFIVYLCHYCIISINTVKGNPVVVSLVIAMGYNPIFSGSDFAVDCMDNYGTITAWHDLPKNPNCEWTGT